MSKQIATLDLDPSALQRVLNAAASGADVDDVLAGYAEEMGPPAYAGEDDFGGADPYSGDESALGADVNTLLEAVQGDELVGEDFGEDFGTDFGADFGADDGGVAASLNQLIQAATAGADEIGIDFGEDDVVGARRRIKRAAKRVRGRRAAKRGGMSRAINKAAMRRAGQNLANKASRGARALPAGSNKEKMMSNLTPAMRRVLDRQTPGEGPHAPIPINLAAGVTAVVAAGGFQDITVRPPKDVVLTNLVIPGEYASRFAIGPISVENDNLLATAGSLPGEMFRPDSRVNQLPNKLVRGGRDIVIRVTNLSGADSPFIAAFIADEADLSERAARGG